MKQSFLASLKGLPRTRAQSMCGRQGFETICFEENAMIAMCAYANTVLLWVNDQGSVVDATPGDPTKLVKD